MSERCGNCPALSSCTEAGRCLLSDSSVPQETPFAKNVETARSTPGPWKAECVGSGGDYDNPVDVYEVTNGYKRICEFVAERDARLIVAAPELLEALEYICEAEWNGVYEAPWFEKARAAIRKAKGQA